MSKERPLTSHLHKELVWRYPLLVNICFSFALCIPVIKWKSSMWANVVQNESIQKLRKRKHRARNASCSIECLNTYMSISSCWMVLSSWVCLWLELLGIEKELNKEFKRKAYIMHMRCENKSIFAILGSMQRNNCSRASIFSIPRLQPMG